MADGRINYGVALDNSQLRTGAAESKKILHGIGQTAATEGQRIDNTMKTVGKTIAGVFAVQQVKEFGMQVAKVRGEFQQLEVAFKTLLGSADKADALMAQLINTAATTPFGMTEIAQGAKQLIAYGVASEDVNETLIRLGDIAAGLSQPIGDLAYLYGTTMVQGRLYTQDLNQFLGRGIPLMEELAKQFGVNKEQVKGLVEEGKVGFPEVQKALWNLTNEGSKFGGLMEAQSHTITGQISNIEDAIEQMYNELGKKSEGVINSVLGATTTIVENWESIGKVLLVVISTYGAYKAAVIAVAAAHKMAAIWGEVQAFLSLTKSITSAKDAMLLLNIATKANPIGLVLGVVAAAATAFSLFSKETSTAAEMTTKFGESASTAIVRINTLSTTLNGLTSGSSTHKKVMDELNSVLEEYGVQAIKEGDKIDTINAKREQAIALIKSEAVERQRANALQQGFDDYIAKINDAQKSLAAEMSNAMTGSILLTDNKELQENASAIATIVGSVVQENISAIAGKTGDEYDKGMDKIFKTIQSRMRAIGISEGTIQQEWMNDALFNHENVIAKYIDQIKTASEEHDRYTNAVNKSADSEKAAADSTTTFNERIAATKRSLQGATDDVFKLYVNIKSLMEKYNENTIGFTIKFNAQVPKWMNNKSIPELQQLAKTFTAAGENLKKGGVANVNGKLYTKQELLQRGADYVQAAYNKQSAKDEAARKAAQAKTTKSTRKSTSSADSARREKQQVDDEIASRNQQIDAIAKAEIEKQQQSELEIRQAKINLQEESFEKELAINELNYDRLIAENEARTKDMLKSLEDQKMLEYENAHPKATKTDEIRYQNSLNLSVADLSSEQQAQIQAYAEIAEQIRIKANKDSLDKMLENALTYEQKRTAITEEYEKKRQQMYTTDADGNKTLRQGVTAGNVETLNAQEAEALQGIDEQFASNSEQYQSWCNAITELTLKELQTLLANAKLQLDNALKNGASETDVAVARAKVAKVEQQITKSNASKGKSLKDWKELHDVLEDGVKGFEEIGDAIGGATGKLMKSAGEIMSTTLGMINSIEMVTQKSAGEITSTTLGMINSIEMVTQKSAEGMNGAAEAGKRTMKTIEKASVILAVISAALQIATAISNMFNHDEERQAEIDGLQTRIDQLQWELDHQDIARLEQKSIDSLIYVRQTMKGIREDMINAAKATGGLFDMIIARSGKISDSETLLKKGAEQLADIYSNVAYAADKALGTSRFDNAREQLENLAKQQMLIKEQIDSENGKKKTDYAKIQDYENKIKELGEQAISLINDIVEEIIGGSATDIAEQLSDAFFEAFKNGEDAAKAWGDKVNEIIADVLKRMMVQKFLEEPLGDLFEKYKKVWFKNGTFQGIDSVVNSMTAFSNDLNGLLPNFQEIINNLPDDLKKYFIGETEASREAAQKGVATASQDSVDEVNGRMTTIQGHTYSISENTKLLVQNTTLILQSVLNIEVNTRGLSQRMENVESNVKAVKDTVNEIALNGLKIK